MNHLKETEKNFLTCAVLIGLVGIALRFLGQTTLGILSIVAAVAFVVVAIRMIAVRKKEEEENSDENSNK